MKNRPALPNPEIAAPAEEAHEALPPIKPARDSVPLLYAAGFVILAIAMLYVWRNPMLPPGPTATEAALDQRLATLEGQVNRLEQHPAPSPPNLAPLIARIDALERRAVPDVSALQARVTALEERPVSDLAPLQSRLDALEARPVPDLGAIQSRLTALEQRPAVDPQVTARMDAIAGRLDALSARSQAAETGLIRRMDADDARIAKLEEGASRVASVADRAARLARLQAAEAALASGQPVGELPGAPAALARYATAKPPTEAALRLAFPAAEQAARAASRPETEGKPFLDRVWNRTQELVTVRQGDQVLVGDPSAGVLARARTALDAGDLAGAVTAVGGLSGEPAQAMAGWLANARALLEARAALADMAARV